MTTCLSQMIARTLALSIAFLSTIAAMADTVTNGILRIDYDSIGRFSLSTGALHPAPDETVFFPVGTSYISVRDYARQQVFVNTTHDDFGTIDAGSGVSAAVLLMGPGATQTLSGTGFRTTWTLPNFNVVQEVEITGAALSDTRVRHEVRVINTSATPLNYGLRYLWDWQIAGNDASLARPRSPDGPYTSTFVAYPSPSFRAYEQTDSLLSPKFTIYGTVQGGITELPPTLPDRVAYVSWSDFYGAAWDMPITGADDDSAIAYYWGYLTPLTLASGASTSFRQYVSTVAGAIGVSTSTTKTMTEYIYAPLNYYFLTSRDSDRTILDTVSGWRRTGLSFTTLTDADPGTRGITRYYFDRVAQRQTRGSHFYTLVAAEKVALNALNPSKLTLPGLPQDEGIDSYAYPPLVEGVGGSCTAGLAPVYRVFRGQIRFPDDPNHRLTTDLATYNQFVALGWDGEGVKMCVPR